MKYTQKDLTDICPVEIAEYIDEIILPEYADGKNTAEMIAIAMKYNALSRLELALRDHIEYYRKYADTALIDTYIAVGINQKILVAYIQTVFDGWEREDTQA